MADGTPQRDTDTERTRDAHAALEAVRRGGGVFGGSALADAARQATDHFAGKDAVGRGEGGGTDHVELWGRRIGRSLSLVGFIALAVYLYVTYLR
jgi:hypothetical protein